MNFRRTMQTWSNARRWRISNFISPLPITATFSPMRYFLTNARNPIILSVNNRWARSPSPSSTSV